MSNVKNKYKREESYLDEWLRERFIELGAFELCLER